MKHKTVNKGERGKKSCGTVQDILRFVGDSWIKNSCTKCYCIAVSYILFYM